MPPPPASGITPVTVPGVPLLPKLRGHFAEFLNEGSLTRLRSSSVSTCVGFGYGHPLLSLEGFSWGLEYNHFWPNGPDSHLGIWLWDLPHSLPPWFHLSYHSQDGLSTPVTPIALTTSRWYRTAATLSYLWRFRLDDSIREHTESQHQCRRRHQPHRDPTACEKNSRTNTSF